MYISFEPFLFNSYLCQNVGLHTHLIYWNYYNVFQRKVYLMQLHFFEFNMMAFILQPVGLH